MGIKNFFTLHSKSMPTLFTQIINGDIPSYTIYENEYVYAFLNIFPKTVGHTLIVPKIEIDHFADVPEPYYSAIFEAAKFLSPVIKKATGCTRVCTAFAGYEIPHCHYHLIPTDSASDINFLEKHEKTSDEDLTQMQQKILSFLS
jgi:histidine triad (HIT) family protein